MMKHKIKSGVYFVAAGISNFSLPFAVYQAYLDRGYFAFGGEWLITALTAIFVFFAINSLTKSYEGLMIENRGFYTEIISKYIKRMQKAERRAGELEQEKESLQSA